MKQIAAVELERCYALADLLDTVPDKDFDIRCWVGRRELGRKTMLFGMIETHPGCGFAGCAIGWAAHCDIFPGFYIDSNGSIVYDPEPGRVYKQKNWHAVMTVMGINQDMAEYLFYPNGYKLDATPAMVAERLRRFASKIAAIRARDRRKVAAPVLVQRKLELVA